MQNTAFFAHLSWEDPTTTEPIEAQINLPAVFGRTAGNTVVLNSSAVSRQHARLEVFNGQLVITDLKSSNGTWVNGQRIDRAILNIDDSITMGPFNITLLNFQAGPGGTAVQSGYEESASGYRGGTISLDVGDLQQQQTYMPPPPQPAPGVMYPGRQPQRPPAPPPPASNFPPPAFRAEQVSVEDLLRSGLPVEETAYLSVGGGLASFIWADHMVIFGADPNTITAIGFEPKPYGRYRRLCANSQIPDHERLRSDSGGTPDNIWGWPGYAVREIASDLRRLRIGHALYIAFKIFGEPTLVETFTPIAGRVFASVDREAKRIGWDQMFIQGRVRAIRKTYDGRYAVAYSKMIGPNRSQHTIILANYLHLGVGYPGIKMLPDLSKYREKTNDFKTVVNAYEDHEHVYNALRQNGGTVLVRGRGIVASRIIQRLYELRKRERAEVRVIHLLRSPITSGHKYKRLSRIVDHHWELQPFNWPKSAWGGPYRDLLEKVDEQTRNALLNDWGGTTTADRTDWRRMVTEGIREGWYELTFGAVSEVVPSEGGGVLTRVTSKTKKVQANLYSDFVIDATGLDGELEDHPLIKDLFEHYRLDKNIKNRLAVSNDFEVVKMRNGPGRIYASGAMTFGNHFAPVDSFTGMAYAAQRICFKLAEEKAPGVKKMNFLRSFWKWFKWLRGAKP